MRLVWLIQTEGRPQVRVWKPTATQPEILTLDDQLDGEDIIPNFILPVRQLFRR